MTGSKGGVTAKLREQQSLKHLLNVHNMRHRLPLACAGSNNQFNFLKEFELTLTQSRVFSSNSPNRLNVYLKTAHQMDNMETLAYKKRKNVVEKVKKAVNTRQLNFHASVDGL